MPGARIGLFYFNEAPDGTAPNRWEQYGTGTVSADGTRIVTDRNPATGLPYGMPRFCCGARGDVDLTPVGLPDNIRSSGPKGGEPVDLATGRFIVRKTDLAQLPQFEGGRNSFSGTYGKSWHYNWAALASGDRILRRSGSARPRRSRSAA